jgi:hypothetical protein
VVEVARGGCSAAAEKPESCLNYGCFSRFFYPGFTVSYSDGYLYIKYICYMDCFYITFDTTLADANRLAEDLQDYIERTEGVKLERIKDNENAQDFGATLVLVLGTPAILAIARGIQTWLGKRNNVTVTVKTPKGEIKATGVSGKDIPRILEGADKIIN